MKSGPYLLLGLVVGLSLQAEAADAESNELTNSISLAWITADALSNNPSLKAARANWEAFAARIPQARAWEDPRVGVDVERSGTTRLDTFTDNEWMIGQELPLSGKNRQRATVASADAETAWAEVRRRELDLIGRVRGAYYRYANTLVQLDLNDRNDELLRQFYTVSLDKYRLGARMQADVLMAETAIVSNSEARRDLERSLSDVESELNLLRNRRPDTYLPPPEPLKFSPFKAHFEELKDMALAHRPEVAGARHQIDAARARVKLAQRGWIPDPEVRVEGRQFNGGGGGFQEYDTGIFFNFPWFNRGKYKGAILEARKNLERAEHELESLQFTTLGMVKDQLKKIETVHHHYELFQSKLLPLAKKSVEANQTAYASDKGSFLELLNALRTVQETESMLSQHLSDYLSALAELETMIGHGGQHHTRRTSRKD